jgi:ubiquinone/menaquinone biosynthesis C-methylase UbiE
MPAMSTVEQAFCRSRFWRWFTRRAIFPWALDGIDLGGEVLELGSGSGAMAQELLTRFPSIRLTATDVDPAMVDAARRRISPFGDRVEVREADATRLPFPDGRFDVVVSFIMLHHTVEWEQALGEAARVLRPGGHLVGYDVVRSAPARALHRLDRSPHRLATIRELTAQFGRLPLDAVRVEPALGGLVVRFAARRTEATADHGDLS